MEILLLEDSTRVYFKRNLMVKSQWVLKVQSLIFISACWNRGEMYGCLAVDSWMREAQEALTALEDLETKIKNQSMEIGRSKLVEVGVKLDRLEALLHNPPSKPILYVPSFLFLFSFLVLLWMKWFNGDLGLGDLLYGYVVFCSVFAKFWSDWVLDFTLYVSGFGYGGCLLGDFALTRWSHGGVLCMRGTCFELLQFLLILILDFTVYISEFSCGGCDILHR